MSIVIPVFNAEATLEKCLSSIRCQSFTDWEIIIVDSDSRDETSFICRQWCKILGAKCKYQNVHIRSRSFARNAGVKMCSGSIVFTLDADDILPLSFFDVCVNYLRVQDYDGFRIPTYEEWRSKSYFSACYYRYLKLDGYDREPYVNFVRRNIWLILCGQKEGLEFGEDADFDTRFRRAGYLAPTSNATNVFHCRDISPSSVLRIMIGSGRARRHTGSAQRLCLRNVVNRHSKIVKGLIDEPQFLFGQTFLIMARLMVGVLLAPTVRLVHRESGRRLHEQSCMTCLTRPDARILHSRS